MGGVSGELFDRPPGRRGRVMIIHKDYPCSPENCRRGRMQPISFLVYHYVGATGGAEANARYFHTTAGTGASAHYFVGRESEDAAVWQSVPEEDTAWHCGRTDGRYRHPACRNANSIGIEMCCRQDPQGNWTIDEATYAAAAALGRDIMARYEIPLEHVLRHYDVTGKLCPLPLIDEDKWTAFKARLEEPMTQEQFNQMMDAWLDQRGTQPPSDWASAAWNRAAATGVFDGTAPQSALTREQAALVLDRLGLLEGKP